jgi:AraC-like DNA-binding protein
LVVLLAVCAVQGLVISLAQHYAVPGFSVVQPITATLIPPLAWVVFQITAVRRITRRDALHIAAPLAAVLCLIVRPVFLDTLIPALFVGYGAAILWVCARGADAMPRMRFETGDLPGRIWRIIGAALIASALSDVLIVAAQMLGAAHLQPWIISIFSSGMLLIVGGLSLSASLISEQPQEEDIPEKHVSEADVQIFEKLEDLMATQQPYLNPDLTLSQLSRKMLVPAKQLSGAINRVTGENVSRYINAARIRAAQQALRDGENVTSAMLSSGFNTKSNFNREFLRVAGQSPSDWLVTQEHWSGTAGGSGYA